MKKLLLSLIIATIAVSAEANMMKCQAQMPGAAKYLLVMSRLAQRQSASIFVSQMGPAGEQWELLYPNAELKQEGPNLYVEGRDKSEVNWAFERECVKFLNPTYKFRLQLTPPMPGRPGVPPSMGGARGNLSIDPNYVLETNQCVNRPPLMPVPATNIICTEL